MTDIPAPTPAQLAWQRAQFGIFFHVGLNTVCLAIDGGMDALRLRPE